MADYHAWGWQEERWNWLCKAESLTAINPLLSAAADAAGIPDVMCCITPSACPPVGRPAAVGHMEELLERLKESPHAG